MNAVLYMQIDANIQIKHPHIYLQDIARLSCSDSKILNRLRVMPVINLKPDAAVKEGDVLSVRGLGKGEILKVGGQSKKGRLFITGGRWK